MISLLNQMPSVLVMSAAVPTPGAAPSAGGASGTAVAPGVAGAPVAAPQSAFGGGGIFIFMLLGLGVLFFFSIMNQRKQKRQRDDMLRGIQKHDRVQTIGGVIGSVMEIKPEVVILKVDESSNTRISFARASVQQVLDASDIAEEQSIEDLEEETVS
ncbi:MAG: preprotein translocase subunit YajC [Phycisphaerales bacterium]|nr:preprotein translocase subunit YajC [Phycisphaerales bacterium]